MGFDSGFDSCVGKIFSSRRKWQSIPVYLPGKSHGQRSLVSYSLKDCKEWDRAVKTQISIALRYTYFLRSDCLLNDLSWGLTGLSATGLAGVWEHLARPLGTGIHSVGSQSRTMVMKVDSESDELGLTWLYQLLEICHWADYLASFSLCSASVKWGY